MRKVLQPLGPGGADVILAQHLQHGGAGHARDHRQRDRSERDGRQDQMAEGRGEGALLVGEQRVDGHESGDAVEIIVQRDAPGDRRPAEIEGEGEDQHQAPDEDRQGIARHGHAHDHMVEGRIALHPRQHAGGKAEDDREEHGADRELERRREEVEELRQDRAMGDQRDAEIAVQHIADIVGELDIKRAVEAHLMQQLGMACGCDSPLAHPDLHRIARDEMDQDESQEDDPEEGRDDQAEAGEDESEHRSSGFQKSESGGQAPRFLPARRISRPCRRPRRCESRGDGPCSP